jgi:hypothetical protein
MKTLRGFLCSFFLLLSLPANAQWQRIVAAIDADYPPDTPAPHALSYWTADPLQRNEGTRLCLGCRLQDGYVVSEKDYKAACKISKIGVLSTYEINQLICHIGGDAAVSDMFTEGAYKFILVETGPGQYREIYHLQDGGGDFQPLKPARIVDMDTESILATYDPGTGNGGGCSEGYWFFDAAGPHQVDFSAVSAAIAQHLPHNATFRPGCWALDLDHQQIKTWAQRADAECHGCGGIGEVTAHFTLSGAKAEPGVIEFQPDADQ